jgi:7-carboxy-7-deazaguanine synthase
MLFSELIPLCQQLRRAACHITIETAGTLYLPIECDLMSISPKTSNSTPPFQQHPKWHERHERTRHCRDVVRRLIGEHDYQIKFVVDRLEDCAEAEAFLQQITDIDRDRVLLMPQGTDRDALESIGRWLEPYCRRHALHFCPRKQVEWFGLVRGT